MEDIQLDSQDIALETPAKDVFIAPSIHPESILSGASYSHCSPIPEIIADDLQTVCVLGVDEAGRGPVLGARTPAAASWKCVEADQPALKVLWFTAYYTFH